MRKLKYHFCIAAVLVQGLCLAQRIEISRIPLDTSCSNLIVDARFGRLAFISLCFDTPAISCNSFVATTDYLTVNQSRDMIFGMLNKQHSMVMNDSGWVKIVDSANNILLQKYISWLVHTNSDDWLPASYLDQSGIFIRRSDSIAFINERLEILWIHPPTPKGKKEKPKLVAFSSIGDSLIFCYRLKCKKGYRFETYFYYDARLTKCKSLTLSNEKRIDPIIRTIGFSISLSYSTTEEGSELIVYDLLSKRKNIYEIHHLHLINYVWLSKERLILSGFDPTIRAMTYPIDPDNIGRQLFGGIAMYSATLSS